MCANRTHTVAELQKRTHDLLTHALNTHDEQTAASLAVRALLYEVCTTPKPGLVDRANNGSHKDMDIFTFMSSSAALWPYFAQCFQVGNSTAAQPGPETFAALRWPGKQAESAMLIATHGVNTHKGAIFSLGLACAALGRLEREHWNKPELILSQISKMTAGTIQHELAGLTQDTAVTAGQQFYLQYGVTGVRGQAEAGFPSVLEYGLPTLENGLAQGKTLDESGVSAMLALLAQFDNSLSPIATDGGVRPGHHAGGAHLPAAGGPHPPTAMWDETTWNSIYSHFAQADYFLRRDTVRAQSLGENAIPVLAGGFEVAPNGIDFPKRPESDSTQASPCA